MNFNEEMERELRELNLGGELIQIKEEDKGTSSDWAILERNIELRARKNEIMLIVSKLNADRLPI